MGDVASVAAPVALDEAHERRRQSLAVCAPPRPHSDPVLAKIADRRVTDQCECEYRINAPRAGKESKRAHHERTDEGRGQAALRILPRRASPWERRPHSHQKDEG